MLNAIEIGGNHMVQFDNNKKQKQSYGMSSSAQFSKYVKQINELHPTKSEAYFGQLQSGVKRTMTLKEAMEMQMRMMYAQQQSSMSVPMQYQSNMGFSIQCQQYPMYQAPAGPPAGFIDAPQYNPYRRNRY